MAAWLASLDGAADGAIGRQELLKEGFVARGSLQHLPGEGLTNLYIYLKSTDRVAARLNSPATSDGLEASLHASGMPGCCSVQTDLSTCY